MHNMTRRSLMKNKYDPSPDAVYDEKYIRKNELEVNQMSLFDTAKDDDIVDEINSLDIGNMTPIDALNTLYKLQNKIKNRWGR